MSNTTNNQIKWSDHRLRRVRMYRRHLGPACQYRSGVLYRYYGWRAASPNHLKYAGSDVTNHTVGCTNL